jgi:hypothetical protein
MHHWRIDEAEVVERIITAMRQPGVDAGGSRNAFCHANFSNQLGNRRSAKRVQQQDCRFRAPAGASSTKLDAADHRAGGVLRKPA